MVGFLLVLFSPLSLLLIYNVVDFGDLDSGMRENIEFFFDRYLDTVFGIMIWNVGVLWCSGLKTVAYLGLEQTMGSWGSDMFFTSHVNCA